MFSRLASLLPRPLTGARRPARGAPSRSAGRRASLAVESLEERCVPTVWNVTSSADTLTMGQPTTNTLRWAVAQAQNGDTIAIQPQVTLELSGVRTAPRDIVLTQGELVLNKSVNIEAVGPQATISGDNLSRVFEVSSSVTVTLNDLNITGGNGVSDNLSAPRYLDGNGGAILNEGTLWVESSTVSGNKVPDNGGGIANVVWWTSGQLYLIGSTVSGNTAGGNGGGVWNDAMLDILGGSIQSNVARGAGGGGLWNSGPNADFGNANNRLGNLSIFGCTLSNNSASGVSGFGGSIDNAGTLAVYNSTLSGNSANLGGGIFSMTATATAYVQGSTLSGNSANVGGGIWNSGPDTGYFYPNGGTMQVVNSTIRQNYALGGSEPGGGGIYNDGSLTVSGCTLSYNDAENGSDGGGISNDGSLTVSGCSLSYNAARAGGGIFTENMATVTGSTLSYNYAATGGAANGGGGGGIAMYMGTLNLGSTNFVGNSPDNVLNFNGYGTFNNEGGNTGL